MTAGLRALAGMLGQIPTPERGDERPAILAPDRPPLTYPGLDRQVAETAGFLSSLGIGHGHRVALLAPNGPEMATAFLGVAAGATCAPLNPSYTAAELDFFLSDLRASAVVVDERLDSPVRGVATSLAIPVVELRPDLDGPAGCFTLEPTGSAEAGGPDRPPGADDVALMLHTSGTTARPKMVPLTHANLGASAGHIAAALGLGPVDRCLNVMPLFHIHGLVGALLSSLGAGGSVVCTPGPRLPDVLEWLRLLEPTWYTAVPTIHQAVLTAAAGERPAHSLRLIRSSSASLPPSVMAELEARFGVPVIESYGMTEAAHQMASNPLPPRRRKPGTVGIAAGPDIAVMGEDGGLLPPGAIGEVVIRGPNVTAGYADNPGANDGAFADGWFRTGDQGAVDDEGYLTLTGRLKELINRGGEKVSPREVDEVLLGHPEVVQAVAFAVAHPTLGEEVAAAVVLRAGSTVTGPALCRFASSRLAPYKVPRRIVVLDEIPKGATGKLQRIGLADRLGVTHGSVAPRTPVEAALAGVWAQLIGVERVGVEDDFFLLGGDSLLATQLVARVADTFDVDIPLPAVFDEAATVAGMAELVEGLRRQARAARVPAPQPLERGSRTPLSPSQELLWFTAEVEQDSTPYNVALGLRLRGAIDEAALQRSLDGLVGRHEALRTVFAVDDDGPHQRVLPAASVVLAHRDAEDLEQARRLATEEAQRPFDLAHGPMLRATLVRVAVDDHVLLLSSHHLACDGWSRDVMQSELVALYAAETLSAPLLQAADVAAWQRGVRRGERLDALLAYWSERLEGCPPALELPADRPRPSRRTFRGAVHTHVIDRELAAGLRRVAQDAGATLFMTLLGGFDVLLHRYTGATDVVVGVPIAGRTRVETEQVVGLLMNTLVLRTDLSDDPTFHELLQRVRQACLGAYEHHELPFETLIERLHPDRSLSRSPLVQVLFQLRNPTPPTVTSAGLAFDRLDVDTGRAKVELSLEVDDHDGELRCRFEYNRDLFDPGTVARIAANFEVVLRSIVDGPERPVHALALLAPESARLLGEWASTRTVERPPVGLHELIEAQADRFPDAPAVECDGVRLTYRELDERANQVAHHLLALGVRRDVPVGIRIERSIDFVASALGTLKAGGACLPLDPTYPPDRLRLMLEEAGDVVVLGEPVGGGQPRHRPAVATGPDDLAYVIFTSGSTGRPRGVELHHRGLVDEALTAAELYGLGPTDRVLQFCSISFDTSVEEIFATLVSGATLVIRTPDAPISGQGFLDWIRQAGVTVLDLPTAFWHAWVHDLAELEASVPDHLRLVVVGGEKALAPMYAAWLRLGGSSVRWINTYGPTEASVIASADEPGAVAPDELPIGRPVDNTLLYVLDGHLQPVPIGAPGELYIGGPGVARGYLGRPELTAELFVDSPFGPGRLYRTGDQVRFRADGNLEFLGRRDHQVKVRGFRVELAEIELALAEHPAVGEAAVLARNDDSGPTRLVAYVVANAGAGAGAKELREFLGGRLPDYMVPSLFTMLEALPLGPTGKVDRAALPAPATTRPELDDGPAAPRTEHEEALLRIWADVLGLDQIGVHDDFFALGGHSLLATRLVSRVRASFGVDVPLRAIFEGPTVADLAALIGRSGPVAVRSPVIGEPDGAQAAPLSFAQQRLWFFDQLTGGEPAYAVALALRLHGDLDVAALEAAVSALVGRHEILRTTFRTLDGMPRQVVHAPGPVVVARHDLTATEDPEAEVAALVDRELARPFDLERGPLLRVALAQLRLDLHTLLLVFHHIVTDGSSDQVIEAELAALYDAARSGQPATLAPLPLQYADYARRQREGPAGDSMTAHQAWWRDHLAGAEALRLPTDRAHPAVPTYRGAAHSLVLEPALGEGVRELGRQRRATLFMTLLAAYEVALQRFSGQDDFLLGSVVANRDSSDTESLIGFFVNTLAIRADCSGDPTFAELVERVRGASLASYDHWELPFEKLVEDLAPARDPARHPLFQVRLLLDPRADDAVEWPGLRATAVALGQPPAEFDLTLRLRETPEGIECCFEYATDVFDEETVARMADHFRAVVEAAVATPERRLSELALLGGVERSRVLVEWNDTAADHALGRTVHELVEEQVARRPGASAVTLGDRTLTYQELDARAERLAGRLGALGVGPGVIVGLCLERGLDLVAAMLAVLKAGGAFLPLDPTYPTARLRFMLDDSRPLVVLMQAKAAAVLPPLTAHVVMLDDEDDDGSGPATAPGPRTMAGPDDLAYVMYTSGSTGQPKAVMVRHRGVVNYLSFLTTEYALGPADRVLQLASASFDPSVRDVFAPLVSGAAVVLVTDDDARDPAALLRVMGQTGVTAVLSMVPSLLHVLLDHDDHDPSCPVRLRLLMTCGERLPMADGRRAEARFGCAVVNQYGPTEGTMVATHHRLRPADRDRLIAPIGRPIDNVRVYLLDPAGEPVPIGVPGEVHIGGVGVTAGYLGRPDLTAERFVPDPFEPAPGGVLFRTGDRARFLADGTIEFLGRFDDQVKVRGFRVEPGEIEAALAGHPDVAEVAVVSREASGGDTRLVACSVAAPGTSASAADLREFLRSRLPAHLVPAGYLTLDVLPRLPNGKVDRVALAALDAEPMGAGASVAPRTPIEQALAAIWCEVLGVSQIGAFDDFFDAGGHSLSATQVVSRARQTFGVDVPLVALFRAPTIAALAEVVGLAGASADEIDAPAPVRASRTGPVPLSFPQQRMWFLDQLDPGSAAYVVTLALRLEGHLVVDALEKAFNEIVARHEALRTTFAVQGGAPVQVVHPPGEVRLEVHDLAGSPNPEASAAEVARRESSRPFDLGRGPMLRVLLLRLSRDEHVLVVAMHHIATDGWSMDVLTSELATLYDAFRAGRPSPLPELALQYADFAAWQRAWLESRSFERALAYWTAQLRGLAPLELPTDRRRPQVASFRGAQHAFTVPPEVADAVRALSQQEGATLFMTLLAIFEALLHRYGDQDEFALGSVIANRNRIELEPLIGVFVNTIALRADCSGDPTLRELVRRARDTALAAYAHQDLRFERLVEELHPVREPARHPVFQVMFVLQNARVSEPALADLRVTRFPVDLGAAVMDLALVMMETADGLVGWLNYNTDLFEAATVARMAEHLLAVAAETTNPDRHLSALSLLDDGERHRVLTEWSGGEPAPLPSGSIVERFRAQVERDPGALAVVDGAQSLTYGELDARAGRLAVELRRLGVGPDVVVGVCAERSVDLVVALVAIVQAGGAYLPLDASHPEDRLMLLLDDAHVTVVVVAGGLGAGLPRRHGQVVLAIDDPTVLASDSVAPTTDSGAKTGVGPADLAYVVYTSGSTGRPKGVAVEHRAVVGLVCDTDYVRLGPGDVVAMASNPSFDALTFEVWGALLNGACLAVLDRDTVLSPEELADAVERHGITTLFLTTAVFNQVAAHRPDAFSRVRSLLFGGERVDPDAVRAVLGAGAPERLLHVYGPTECTTFATWHEVRSVDATATTVPIGRPVGRTEVYVLDGFGRPVAPGLPGELHLGGPRLARGYLARDELTASRFVPHPFSTRPGARLYRTGDRVRFLPDGALEFLGRLDDQVKLRGYRIEPGEVEAALRRHPAVAEATVVVREDRPGDRRLAGYAVPRPGAAVAGGELRTFLRASLPEYLVPTDVVVLDALPLSVNGKIDRGALPAPSRSGADDVAPSDDVERALLAIWQEVLGLDRAGSTTDEFFELGGHSLLAVRLLAEVERVFGRRLPLSVFFQGATVAHLAEVLRVGDDSNVPTSVVPIQPLGTRPPLFCVHAGEGGFIAMRHIAAVLGSDQPILGLWTPAMRGPRAARRRVEDIAASCLEAMRRSAPRGPYHLFGHSVGGLVAYEMARRLSADGEDVTLLLVDTVCPTTNRFVVRTRRRLRRARRGGPAAVARYVVRRARRVARRRQDAVAVLAEVDAVIAGTDETFDLHEARERGRRYRPGPTTAPTAVFWIRSSADRVDDPSLGWGRLVRGACELHEVPGSHLSLMRPPYVQVLAEKLGQVLYRTGD